MPMLLDAGPLPNIASPAALRSFACAHPSRGRAERRGPWRGGTGENTSSRGQGVTTDGNRALVDEMIHLQEYGGEGAMCERMADH